VRPVRDPSYLEGKTLEFKVIKLDQKRNNVVVSRRAVVEQEYSAERTELLDKLQEGTVIKGVVKNLTDYGAFVDLVASTACCTSPTWRGSASSILRKSSTWATRSRSASSSSTASVSASAWAEAARRRPWQNIARRYPSGTRLFGKVTNIADYGCFVEIEEGVEGLVHVSEMDWTNKNVNPSKVVHIGEEVEVMVLDIDEDDVASRSASSSASPTRGASSPTTTTVATASRQIRSITDFGLFIGLPGGIDGLVHLSDLSWDIPGEEAVRGYQKAQTVEAIVVAIDPERERISLSVKQLAKDPFSSWIAEHPKGTIVKGLVKDVDAKGAVVDLGGGIEGTCAPRSCRAIASRTLAPCSSRVTRSKHASWPWTARCGPSRCRSRPRKATKKRSGAELPLRFDDWHQPRGSPEGADLRTVSSDRWQARGGKEPPRA
jgi:small subunit ribosomal protein S1